MTFGLLKASTMAMVWLEGEVIGRLYAEWNCDGPYPEGRAAPTTRPAASVCTSAKHSARVGDVEIPQTRFAWNEGAATVWIVGTRATVVSTPARTTSRRSIQLLLCSGSAPHR